MDVKELITKVTDLTENMFKQENNIYDNVRKIIPDMQNVYQVFIGLIPSLNSIGMEIDMEVILQQLKNLSLSIENRDKVMLFDTLNYEIKNTLLLYDEIKAIMEQG